MTLEEFLAQSGVLPCIFCQSVELATREKPPHVELYCVECGRHQRFLAKTPKPNKRPKLQSGTLDEVWRGSGGHCAHCGLNEATMAQLGLIRTVQHVPPFCVNGHEGYLIPLCNWCQAHSATEMKKLTSLVERLARKMDINNG